jgi:spore maturation protein CgeB
LNALWETDAPQDMRAQLAALGERLIELKLADITTATAWHLPQATDEHPAAVWWLTTNFPVYFKMSEIFWEFRSWQRYFIPAYLARYFKVAVFGGNWSSVGVATGGWVDFENMPAAFARGKVGLNIVTGFDEEGVTAKTFEIAASGVPLFNNECKGLGDLFEIGKEIEIFKSPREAREKVAELIANPQRRFELAGAIRSRFERDHTWDHRVRQMLSLAGLQLEHFMK